jgi:lipocalin
MIALMTILFNLFVILQCLSQSHGSDESSAPDTVATLNAPAYLGRWYQTYGSAIPLSTFEKDGYCITADYYNPSAVGFKGLSFSLVNTLK